MDTSVPEVGGGGEGVGGRVLWKRKKKSVCLRLQNAIPHYFVLRQHFLPICPQPTSQVIILFYYCRANKVKPNVINWEHIQFQNSKLEGINQSSSSFQTLIISLNILCKIHLIYFLRFYLFIFREGKGEKEEHQCVVTSHMPPNWGPGRQPRHVP